MSKALDRSKNIPTVCNWLSVAFAILSINVSKACEVDMNTLIVQVLKRQMLRGILGDNYLKLILIGKNNP